MAKVNVVEVISNSKFNRFHLGLFIWSFMIILFDGYDLSVYGTALPLIMEDWNLTRFKQGQWQVMDYLEWCLEPLSLVY